MNTDSWRRVSWKGALFASYCALGLVSLVRVFQYGCLGYGGEDSFTLAYLGRQSAGDFVAFALLVPAHLVDVVVFGLPAFVVGAVVEATGSGYCSAISYVVLGQALAICVGRWPGSFVDAFKLSVLAVASVLRSRKESRMPSDDEYLRKASDRPQSEPEVVSESGIRAEMESIRREYPSLPMVPIEPIRYRGWITETVDQIQAGVLTKTLDRKLAVLERVNRVYENLFKLAHTQYETGRFRGKEKLEDLKLEAELEETRLRIEKARAEIRKVQERGRPRRAELSPAQEMMLEFFTAVETLAGLERTWERAQEEFAEEMKKSEFHSWAKNMYDTKRMRILEGRRSEQEGQEE